MTTCQADRCAFPRCRVVGRRLAVALGGLAIVAIGGCGLSPERRELGVVARDVETGNALAGVRIHRRVEDPVERDVPAQAVAITDPAGLAVLPNPRPDSSWIAVRDGYEPRLVDPEDLGVRWNEGPEAGTLDLELTPISWRTVRLGVVDSDTGAPVPGAVVECTPRFPLDPAARDLRGGGPVTVGTRTDANGFAWVDLRSASTSEIVVTADDHVASTLVLDPDAPGGVERRLTIPLQAHRYEPTRVVVLDRRSGRPVEGVVVRVGLVDPATGEVRSEALWTTGADGTVVVMRPAGALGTLAVEHADRPASEFRVLEIHATELSTLAIGRDEFE